MFKIQLSLLILFFSIAIDQVCCQVKVDTLHNENKIYLTTYGLKNDKSPYENIDFKIKSEGENYIEVERFTDLQTGKLVNDVLNIWAVKYKEEYYFHLAYARGVEFDGLKKFIKINKEEINNKHFIFSIDCETPIAPPTSVAEAVILAGVVTTVTLSGVYILIPHKEIKSSNYWVKENEGWAYIYYADTKNEFDPKAKILTKKRLKKLYPKDKELHKRIDNKEVLYEEALMLIKNLNND